MFQVAGADGVRVQLEAPEVHDPCESRSIIDHDFFRFTTRRERQTNRPQPFGPPDRRALLIESVAFGAINKSLENDWPITNARECTGCNRKVVLNEIKFR